MSTFKDFLKSKVFLVNVIAAIVIISILLWSAGNFLSDFTRHGQFIVLPDLKNIKLNPAKELLKRMQLNYIVIDSEYNETLPPGIVINQNPYPGAHVKSGRNVYLYITSSVPPIVVMPDLIDKSLREAELILANSGLKTGDIKYQPDPFVGIVLKQYYKDNSIIPGTKIPAGSRINLLVSESSSDTLKR